MMSWWDDVKWQRNIGADQTASVTDQAAAVTVTPMHGGRWWNRCVCEMCGKDFFSKRRKMGTKFCSPACRQKHYRENKKLYL